MTQNYFWQDIRQNPGYADGPRGNNWYMWNQFKQMAGMSHQKKRCLKPISYEKFMTTWPCLIFRLDKAPANSIILDNQIGFGTHDLQVKWDKDSGTINSLNQGNVYWFVTLISDSMTRLDQSGCFTYINVARLFTPNAPITQQRILKIAQSGNLIDLLQRLRSMPSNPGPIEGAS